jgi:hypothetical protein
MLIRLADDHRTSKNMVSIINYLVIRTHPRALVALLSGCGGGGGIRRNIGPSAGSGSARGHQWLLHTTNAIESINMSLRKVIKTRSSFPTDEAVSKLFYLALNNISKQWTMTMRDWKAALNRFGIQFEDRVSQA